CATPKNFHDDGNSEDYGLDSW
nr:immunoglobulin heavy chain junction region [Macaca mulatta]